jgi:hypothetical protein
MGRPVYQGRRSLVDQRNLYAGVGDSFDAFTASVLKRASAPYSIACDYPCKLGFCLSAAAKV